MGGHYSREAIHKRLLDYDPADISAEAIRNDSELPSPYTLKKYAGKSYEHISGLKDLKDLVAEDHLQVWQGHDESIERAVEQAVEEMGEKPKQSNLETYFENRERFPGNYALFHNSGRRYSGALQDLRPKLEVTEENLRAYSDRDKHIEETILYIHDELGQEAPTNNELRDFLKDQPVLLSFNEYEARYSDGINALFEKHDKEVNSSGGQENEAIPLSDQDEGLLWGMMLGDGYCPPGRGDNENPHIVYASTDKPQIQMLKEQTDANIWTDKIHTVRREDKKDMHSSRTKQLPNLTKFREPYQSVLNGHADPHFFWSTWEGIAGETFAYSTWKMMDMSERMKSRKARIPEGLEVSPELMMAWYLGDGTLNKQSGNPRITAQFPKEDYQRIQSQLEDKVFDGLESPDKASSINKKKGRWSLTPSVDRIYTEEEKGYIASQGDANLQQGLRWEVSKSITDYNTNAMAHTDETKKRIASHTNEDLSLHSQTPLKCDMIIDKKNLRINKSGAEAFFNYLPDHDDWDNVMPDKFRD